MSFVPDSDANYQAFLRARAKFNGPDADVFTRQFVQFMANQSTLGSTSNSALITSAITAAQAAVRQANSVAPNDGNYAATLRLQGVFAGADGSDFLEHCVKGHCQLATAVTTLSNAVHANVNANSKTATVAKKHTY